MSSPKRIIYPPIWMVIGLIILFILDEYLPLLGFSSSFASTLGYLAIVLGLVSAAYAIGMFKIAKTNLIPFKNATTTLLTTGIYRVTRNPMYLGMALMLLGASLIAGTLAGLFVVPIFMAIIEIRFIRPEEMILRKLFGKDFENYCQQVRRWL